MSAWISRHGLLWATVLLAGPAGCRDDAGGEGDDAGDDPSGMATSPDPEGSGSDGSDGSAGSAGSEDGYEVPLPEPPPPGGECEPGVVEPCTCEGGGSGERVCLPDGRFSACGCTQDDDGVYEPPPPPEYEHCGDTPCPPYPFPPSDYSAQHCCTPEDACGSTNANLFVDTTTICIERGGDGGTPSPDCPDESIAFVDFLGCCMENGQCGMTLDETMPNWDVGCIDRTLWKPMLDGLSTRWFAALLFGFDPNVPDWQPIACTPAR